MKNFKVTQKFLFIVLLFLHLGKLLLTIRLVKVTEFRDHDLIHFYEPAARNFSSIFLSSNPENPFLSSLVTPIFPLFLNFFGTSVFAHMTYFFLSIFILFIIYKVCLVFVSKIMSTLAILFLSIEPSFLISSLSLTPELLFSFTIVSALYFIICKPFRNNNLNLTVFSSLVGISVLIRPIALIMIFVLSIFWLYRFFARQNLSNFLFAVLTSIFAVMWSIRNYILHGIFTVSSISANNLLWYEGVPAFAEEIGISFEQAAKIESERRINLLGEGASVSDTFSYNTARGIELIYKYPFGWLLSHLNGLGKILFGVHKSKIQIIDSNIFGLNNEFVQNVHFVFLGCIVLTGWLFFIQGIKGFLSFNAFNAQLYMILLLSIIIPATGQIAYARFRSPAMPLICIVSIIGFSKFLSIYGQKKTLNRGPINKKVSQFRSYKAKK